MRIHELDRMSETKDKPYWICTNEERNPDNESAIQQFIDCMKQPSVIQGFMAPDFHGGYVAPIGSVLKTEGTIFSSFVGYDIGCGMSECTLDLQVSDLTKDQLTKIKDEILKRVPIGFSRHKKNQPIQRDLKDLPMTDFAKDILMSQGGTQIGTLGGGKDYCFQAQH